MKSVLRLPWLIKPIHMPRQVTLYASLAVISLSIVTALSLKDKRICRSCGEFSKLIEKRLEETAANPRIIEVAGRIGPDGRPIPSRKIDYLTS